jgi:hypothetical protein
LHCFQVSFAGCDVQWCVTSLAHSVDVSAELSDQASHYFQVAQLSCDTQGREVSPICLINVSAKLLDQASNRTNHAIIHCCAQRFRAAHTDTSLGPSPQLVDIAPCARLQDHHLSHLRPRGSARASTAAAAAAFSACGRIGDGGARWVRRPEVSQHVVEVIVGFRSRRVALLALALALISIVAPPFLVLLWHSERR